MNPLTPAPEPLLWTIRQTAAALGICAKSVWNLSRTGRLRAVKIGRATRYDVADVRAFIENAKIEGGGT